MTNVRKNSAKLTREDLKIAPESPTMKLSETPAENLLTRPEKPSDTPRSFTGWKRLPNCWRSPTVLRTICATPRKISR